MFSDVSASFAAALAVATLCGYAAGLPVLVSWGTGLAGMSPLTALCICCLAASVACTVRGRDRLRTFFAAAAATVGVVIGGSYLLHGTDAIDPEIVQVVFSSYAASSGRTAIATALLILLLSVGLLLVRKRPSAVDAIGAVTFFTSLAALLGYAYGVDDIYLIPVYRNMSIHTALSLAALSMAVVSLQRDKGWAAVVSAPGPAGRATRRQLLFVLLVPVLGLILDHLYDIGELGEGAVVALFVTLVIAPLALLILRDGRILEELEALARQKRELQQGFADELQIELDLRTEELRQESAERLDIEQSMHKAQRLEAMGRLTGGIAHDFNNLLQTISAHVELAQRAHDGARQARHLTGAKDGVRKAARLATQLLTFSRSQDLAMRPVLISQALRSSRDLIGASLGPDIAIVVEVPKQDLWVMTDADQFDNALLNLALNAKDAMPQGGVLLIEAALQDGDRIKGPETTFVSIRVIDSGTGMSADVLARAIEPFFTTKAQSEGTGLGLAQVHGFVSQSKGELRIDSKEGVGTTIELLLPETEAPSSPVSPNSAVAPDTSSDVVSQPVLVIDDDDDVRLTTVEVLREAGYLVLEAGDGASGLHLLQAHKPALLLVDFLMPGMNGADVASQAREIDPALPVVFMTGYSDTTALSTIVGSTVLRKPFDVDQLVAAVSDALSYE